MGVHPLVLHSLGSILWLFMFFQDDRAWYGAALRVRPSAAHLPPHALALLRVPEHMRLWTSDALLQLVDHLLQLRGGMVQAGRGLPIARPDSIAAHLRHMRLPSCGQQLGLVRRSVSHVASCSFCSLQILSNIHIILRGVVSVISCRACLINVISIDFKIFHVIFPRTQSRKCPVSILIPLVVV